MCGVRVAQGAGGRVCAVQLRARSAPLSRCGRCARLRGRATHGQAGARGAREAGQATPRESRPRPSHRHCVRVRATVCVCACRVRSPGPQAPGGVCGCRGRRHGTSCSGGRRHQRLQREDRARLPLLAGQHVESRRRLRQGEAAHLDTLLASGLPAPHPERGASRALQERCGRPAARLPEPCGAGGERCTALCTGRVGDKCASVSPRSACSVYLQGGWATGDPMTSWGPGSLEETYTGENADAPGIPCKLNAQEACVCGQHARGPSATCPPPSSCSYVA